MNREPTVIITNATARTDYTEAMAFGTLKVLSTKLYSFAPNSPANSVLSQDVRAAVEMFDPEIDYVLPSGSSLSTALLLIGLFSRGIRKIRVLMWSGNDQGYHDEILDLGIATGAQNV